MGIGGASFGAGTELGTALDRPGVVIVYRTESGVGTKC